MSDTLADLSSCLPSEFLSGEMDDKPLFLNPHRLPYDFASSSSTESESDNDDDFPGLTRRFTRSVSLQERLKIPYPVEKKRVFSGSPESTLSWNVSGPTHVRSSPTTPFDEDAWDLIYAAAGQVSRVKMNVNHNGFGNRGLLGAPRLLRHPLPHHTQNCAMLRTENEVFLRQQQLRERVTCGVNYGHYVSGRPVGFGQSAWPLHPVETQRRQQPADSFVLKPVSSGSIGGGCGSGFPAVKKGCAGTGVFLPRNYSNVPPETKKKPVCSANTPPRMAQSINKNLDATIAPQSQANNIHGVFSRQHQAAPLPQRHLKCDELAEMIKAHRQIAVLLAQQRRSNSSSHESEVVLPQEWTY